MEVEREQTDQPVAVQAASVMMGSERQQAALHTLPRVARCRMLLVALTSTHLPRP